MRFSTKILRTLSLALLSFSGLKPTEATCEISKTTGINFNCGDIPLPFQPCEDFSLFTGIASTATTMWLLGEDHSQTEKTEKCIEMLTASVGKHIIYNEGYEAGKIIACDEVTPRIKAKPNRICMGWDDTQVLEKTKNLDFRQNDLYIGTFEQALRQFQQNFETTQPSDPQFLMMLKNARLFYSKLSGKEAKDQSAREILEVVDLLIKENNIGVAFNDAFKKIRKTKITAYKNTYTPASLENRKKFKVLIKTRMTSLNNILNQHPSDTLGFVRIGRAHIIPKDEIDTGEANYLQDELKKGKHKGKFATMGMK